MALPATAALSIVDQRFAAFRAGLRLWRLRWAQVVAGHRHSPLLRRLLLAGPPQPAQPASNMDRLLRLLLIATATVARCGTPPRASAVHQINNELTRVVFASDATDIWPVGIESVGGAAAAKIALGLRSPGSWQVALHSNLSMLVTSHPSNCTSMVVDESGLPSILVTQWSGCSSGADSRAGKNDGAAAAAEPALLAPVLTVRTRWELPAGSDTVRTTIEVVVANADETPYRLWLARHPRVAVLPLGSQGSDRLARGILGGEVFGNPIAYRGANKRPNRWCCI